MKQIVIAFGFASAMCWFGAAAANADDCPSGQHFRMSGACANAQGNKGQVRKKLPPGYVMFPNAQGQNVPIKHATTYAQCLHNGHALGYSDAQAQTYCHEHYAH